MNAWAPRLPLLLAPSPIPSSGLIHEFANVGCSCNKYRPLLISTSQLDCRPSSGLIHESANSGRSCNKYRPLLISTSQLDCRYFGITGLSCTPLVHKWLERKK